MFTIEVKDEQGWLDYKSLGDRDEAIKEAIALRDSFGEFVKVIDLANMLCIWDAANPNK